MKNHHSYRVAIVRAVGSDARQLNALAQSITAIAPLIEIVDDEHVLVPMRGPTRYFGGEKAVAEKLFSCAPEHVVLTIGIADGRLAGLIAARMAQPLFVVPAGEISRVFGRYRRAVPRRVRRCICAYFVATFSLGVVDVRKSCCNE